MSKEQQKMDFQTIVCLFLLPFLFGTEAQCPADNSPLPNNNTCGSFYNCSTGSKILQDCPPGTYYNCMTQNCEAQTFPFCCKSSDTSIYITETGINYPCLNGTAARHYELEDSYYVCVDGIRILSGQCDYKYFYCEASRSCYIKGNETCTPGINHINTANASIATSGSLVSEAPWATCPTDNSNFNDHKNCSIYYNCSSGVPSLYKCPVGYFYDIFNDVCSTVVDVYGCYQDVTMLPSSLNKTYLYKCKNGRSSTVDENLFYECWNNNILYGECGDLKYCNFTKSCYNPVTTNCTKPVVTTTSTTPVASISSPTLTTFSTTSNTSSGPPSKCFNTSVTGVYADCTKYVYFNSSGSYTFQCKNNLYFNSFKKCCVSSTEVYTPACGGAPNQPSISDNTCLSPGKNVENLKSCANYFSCNSSYQIQAQTCPSGQLFDWKLGKCTSAFTANVVPGCTTSKYCINVKPFRGLICKFLKWAPGFLFTALRNYCNGLICSTT